MTVSHIIRMVKGIFLLDIGNVESSTSLIPNMIIAHSLCVHAAYQDVSLKLERYWGDKNACNLGKTTTLSTLKMLNLDIFKKPSKIAIKKPEMPSCDAAYYIR